MISTNRENHRQQSSPIVVLRWIAILPAAFAAGILARYATVFLRRFAYGWHGYADFEDVFWLITELSISGIALGAAFVIAATAVAPNAKREVAVISAGLALVLAGYLLYPSIEGGEYWAIYELLCMGGGASGVAYYVLKEGYLIPQGQLDEERLPLEYPVGGESEQLENPEVIDVASSDSRIADGLKGVVGRLVGVVTLGAIGYVGYSTFLTRCVDPVKEFMQADWETHWKEKSESLAFMMLFSEGLQTSEDVQEGVGNLKAWIQSVPSNERMSLRGNLQSLAEATALYRQECWRNLMGQMPAPRFENIVRREDLERIRSESGLWSACELWLDRMGTQVDAYESSPADLKRDAESMFSGREFPDFARNKHRAYCFEFLNRVFGRADDTPNKRSLTWQYERDDRLYELAQVVTMFPESYSDYREEGELEDLWNWIQSLTGTEREQLQRSLHAFLNLYVSVQLIAYDSVLRSLEFDVQGYVSTWKQVEQFSHEPGFVRSWQEMLSLRAEESEIPDFEASLRKLLLENPADLSDDSITRGIENFGMKFSNIYDDHVRELFAATPPRK